MKALRDWFANPWGQPRALGAITWLYMVWSIVPVGIGGSERALRKGQKVPRPVKITVVVGEPIRPEAPADGRRTSRRAVHELTLRLRDEVQRLFDEAQEDVGA